MYIFSAALLSPCAPHCHHDSIIKLFSVVDGSSALAGILLWLNSLFLCQLLNPCNSSGFVSSSDYCLSAFTERVMARPHSSFSPSVKTLETQFRGGAVPARCCLLRLIALIICCTQRQIYSSF